MQTSVSIRAMSSLVVLFCIVGISAAETVAQDQSVAEANEDVKRFEETASVWSRLRATFNRLQLGAKDKSKQNSHRVIRPETQKTPAKNNSAKQKTEQPQVKAAGIKGDNGRLESTAVISVELSHGAKLAPFRVTQRAKLAGTLKVRIRGRRPKLGDSFEVLSAGWIDGKFERLKLPRLSSGLKWHIVYESIRDQRDHDRDGRADVRIIVVRDRD